MKVLLNKYNKHIRLKVVEVAETADELLLKIQDELSKDEQASLNDIGHIKRKKEWLSVRVLLKEMLGKYTPIVYDEYRNPYIQEPYEISITHSKNIVGITLSKKKIHRNRF
jgi:phosphopantetheinyl transferase